MKKRTWLALGMAAALCMGISAAADETEAVETEAETEAVAAEAETAAESEAAEAAAGEVLEKIIVQTGETGQAIEITNTAGLDIVSSSVEPQEEEGVVTITLVDRDGQTYEFEDVQYEILIDPELVKEGVFAQIRYTSLISGEINSAPQTGELLYEEPVEQFAVDDVYIRSEADAEADIVGMISRGDAIEVLGETATHYIVKKDDITGYTVRRCISEDEQEAIAAVKAEEAARAAIEAQAAAAAAAAAQSSGGGVSEVKRQKFDDCDGSGHGYYLITYSDGSTATQTY